MNKIMLMAGLALLAQVSTATDRTWGKVNGSYDGVFIDTAHWTGSTVPQAGDNAGINAAASYTVTFPSGVCTNFANFRAKVTTGNTLVLDGREGAFVHPENSAQNYDYRGFRAEDNGGDDLLQIVNNGKTSYTHDPHLEFANWKITMSSVLSTDSKLSFDTGSFNFRDPCGYTYVSASQFPSLVAFSFGTGTTTASRQLAEIEVRNGASLRLPVLGLQGNAVSNVFRVVGGTHLAEYLEMPFNVNGWGVVNTGRTVTDFILDDGADFEVVKAIELCGFNRANTHVERVFVRNGSVLRFPSTVAETTAQYGEIHLCADGGTVRMDERESCGQYFISDSPAAVSFAAKNGGMLYLKHSGNDSKGQANGLHFGSKATEAGSALKHAFDFDGSTLELASSGNLYAYGAKWKFRNGAVIDNAGTISFRGRAADETVMILDNSVVTNTGTLDVFAKGSCRLVLTNGTRIVNQSNMRIGIGDVDTGVSTLDIYDSEVVLDGTGTPLLQSSRTTGPKSVINLYSGTIRCANTAAGDMALDPAYAGCGDFNIYGGAVTNNNTRFAVSGGADDPSAESRFCMYGGEYIVKDVNNVALGLSVGGAYSYGSTGRRARVVLNGGVLSAWTTFGGKSARCNGGTGWIAFEADGGRITSPADSTHVLEKFDEAKVGPKGLTIDSAGHALTVAQSVWANKDGEEGCIVFAGAGVKTMKGDIKDVSNIVLAGGTTDLSAIPDATLQNLVVTNGATLQLDPAKTLKVASATFGRACLSFTSTLAIGSNYDIILSETEFSAASLANIQKMYVSAGLPAGAVCDFAQVSNGENGGYFLRMTVRAAQDVVIPLDEGSATDSDEHLFLPNERLVAQVSSGAALTLSGKLGEGRFVKEGDGAVILTGNENCFLPGFRLAGGSISFSDLRALAFGDSTYAAAEARNGVLEITGPADGLEVPWRVSMTQDSTNDIFIVRNEVDVTMPIPAGTKKGEFVKRGVGKLTLQVEGASNVFTGGRGKGMISSNYNVWGGTGASIVQLVFDETSGMVTTSGVPAFLVAEGELEIAGRGDGAAVKLGGVGCVGVSTTVGSVQPGLVLNNVKLEQDTYPDTWFYVGAGVNNGRSGDFATAPYVVLTNNATLMCAQFEVGALMMGEGAVPRLEVVGSFLSAGNWFTPNAADDAKVVPQVVFRDGARLGTRRFRVARDCTVLFDGSELANYEHGFPEPMSIDPIAQSTVFTATLNFRNGSRLYCSKVNTDTLNTSVYHPLTVSFDNSEWCLTNTTEGAFSFPHPDKIRIVAEAGGLKLPVLEGATWTMNHEVVGEGGLVNNGKGVLKLDETTVGYTGATRAEAGATIDLGGHVQSITLAGAGTFQNGTLAAGSAIACSADGTDVPTVSNVAFGGIVRVDLGRTTDNPLTEPFKTFTVLKYTGAVPNVSKLRLKGTGVKYLGGEFKAESGVVTCTPKFSGSLLIVR